MLTVAARGFIGLIALLISVLLMGILLWRMDILTGSATATATTSEPYSPMLQGSTQIEQGVNAIDRAQRAKTQIETNYKLEMQGL